MTSYSTPDQQKLIKGIQVSDYTGNGIEGRLSLSNGIDLPHARGYEESARIPRKPWRSLRSRETSLIVARSAPFVLASSVAIITIPTTLMILIGKTNLFGNLAAITPKLIRFAESLVIDRQVNIRFLGANM